MEEAAAAAAATATGVDLSRKFVSETELDENRKKRQEEWEKVRKPEDPEEAPEEKYDPRTLFERLQEQKDKKQEEFEEQFKFRNMVRGLDEDESSFLDEVSRQQSLVEKQRRDEEKQELSSQSSDSSKKQKVEITKTGTTGNGDRQTEQEDGAGGAERAEVQQTALMAKTTSAPLSSERGVLHLPSAAVCVGVLPGLCVYSGSSDSDSSSDSEGSVDTIMLPYHRHSRA
ncbi:hypothetical protein CgunFtcFv8_013542 [Champsocephalus gunnari]|uniref:FAM192A/Fyv6 N-terminal domain-containing protein n=1 Tax=Champsocephalus gunnari TaxID=52237 RepID=A0AAN8E1K9_CHAGU|nr:hypothetical protein CgunFtcFv8_013542 [Champsocephalus gunnari]